MNRDVHHKPYTSLNSYYGIRMGPLKTMNVYNTFGIIVARAIDDDTAELIASALNAYDKPEIRRK